MAKLKSIIQFNGSLEGLSAYDMEGVEGTVVRRSYGPSKEDIETKPQYDITRRNIKETGGRSKAVSWLMRTFQPLKFQADFDTAGQLNKLLRVIQKEDAVSIYGQRAVLLSAHPGLLEGFSLTKALPFDHTVRGGVDVQLSKAALSASVSLPALIPQLTFFPPEGYSYYRVVVTLGAAPDLFYGLPKYRPLGDYTPCWPQSAQTEWFPAATGAPAQTLALTLPYTPPNDAFSLVLTIGVQLGAPVIGGAIEPVRKRVGSAKILAAV